jgi:hypothetical protein
MECQECREDLIAKIEHTASCAQGVGTKLDSKLSLRNFGIAIFCLAVPIFAYLISLNVMVGNCAGEDDTAEFEKFVIESVTKIQSSVIHNQETFQKYADHVEKSDIARDNACTARDKRIRNVERAIDSHNIKRAPEAPTTR